MSLRRQAAERGFLASFAPQRSILVEFQYNPTQLSDRRAATYATLTAPGLVMPLRQYTQGGDRSISFTVRIDGAAEGPADATVAIERAQDGSIGPELNKYRAFLYPQTDDWHDAGGSFAPLYDRALQFAAPPPCVFGFGEKVIDCVVTDVGIEELLFNEQLSPLRADVSVTVTEVAAYGQAAV